MQMQNWDWRQVLEKALISAFFGLVYYLAFETSFRLDLVAGYAPGISLIFLPAGVKLVAALVAGFWGVLGVVIALAYEARSVWENQHFGFYLVYACLGGFSTLLVVELLKRLLNIQPDLRNLRLLHLPVIDLFSTLFHGFVLNTYLITLHMDVGKGLLTRATAMAVGDFNGGLILLLSLAVILKAHAFVAKRCCS